MISSIKYLNYKLDRNGWLAFCGWKYLDNDNIDNVVNDKCQYTCKSELHGKPHEKISMMYHCRNQHYHNYHHITNVISTQLINVEGMQERERKIWGYKKLRRLLVLHFSLRKSSLQKTLNWKTRKSCEWLDSSNHFNPLLNIEFSQAGHSPACSLFDKKWVGEKFISEGSMKGKKQKK